MADTVTPKLGLVKPEVGASADSWGTKWNANADVLDTKIVRNSIQWTITTGDDNPTSSLGYFIITRYGNNTLRIDDPFYIDRQTGDTHVNNSLYAVKSLYVGESITAVGNIKGADITAARSLTDGVYFFGSNNLSYIFFNSGQYTINGGPISVASGTSYFAGISTPNATVSSVVQAPYFRQSYAGPPGSPPGVATFFTDGNGNPCFQRPNGTVEYLGVPPGTVAYTAGYAPDVGWAFCNGQWLPKASYPRLNTVIGNVYGGDANNLALPDIRGRVVAGVDDNATGRLINTLGGAHLGAVGGLDYHYLTQAQIPAHTHYTDGTGSGTTHSMNRNQSHGHGVTGGVYGGTISFQRPRDFAADATIPYNASAISISAQNTDHEHNFDFSWGNWSRLDSGLGSSWHPNVQPTICLYAQIKLG